MNADGALSPLMTVRPMDLDDVDRRIAYFHDSSDDFLRQLGVDRSLLPERKDWKETYRLDFERPIEERQGYGVMWLVDDEVVGWSNVDQIDFGRQALMHLHIADPDDRASGFGAHFVILAVRHFFQVLGLDRLYCEPNAFNVAPNRTLQRAGFRYEFSHMATPGPLNFEQATTRWVITGPLPLPTGR
ncbi:GNAT family N-acetyltransferase [Ilumatobacter sp.]|uniref:GNAT family N-acetyltransferase n=1 Tax=Ilumatobacter sp. TaxID=1967498 RepID=UPI0037500FBB